MNMLRSFYYLAEFFLLLAVAGFGFFISVPTTFAAGPFTVNSLADDGDISPGDGACATAGAVCTFRAALQESDALAGADVINFLVTGTTTPATPYGTLIDVAGVTINGPGSGSFEIDASGLSLSDNIVIGLSNSDNGGISGITITNTPGTAISVTDSDNNIFDDLVLSGRDMVGTTLIEVGSSNGNTFSNNTLSNAGIGIRVGFHSDGNTVSDNVSTNNVHSGITISNSAFNTVTGNSISNIADDYGMFIIGGADNNTISNNTITNANLGGMTFGIRAPDDSGTINNNVIADNTITGSGSGMSLSGTVEHNTFEGNTISNNTNSGITIAYNNLELPQYVAEGNIFIGNILTDNGSSGISIQHALDITIGGTNPGEGNIITGNGGDGVSVQDSETVTVLGNTLAGNTNAGVTVSSVTDITIQGNYIGLESDGITLSSNDGGISIADSSSVVIGGTTASSRNYIVGSGTRGMELSGTLATTSVIGNYLGLDKNGTSVGALSLGIGLDSGDMSGVIIGGTNADEGNVIAGVTAEGTGAGIQIPGSGVRVFGNKIGTNTSGVVTVGYGNEIGIMLVGPASSNQIGGINAGESNIIAGNSTTGVLVLGLDPDYPQDNAILKNSIFGNTNNGIDHALFDGVSIVNSGSNTNDTGDADAGANSLLNHPVINTVNTTTGDVTYTLDVPVGDYRIEFYKNPTSGTYGEGEVFLDYDTFTSTGSSKQQTKTLSLTSGDFITATATEDLGGGDYGSTSEFSQEYTLIITALPRTRVIGGCVLPLILVNGTCKNQKTQSQEPEKILGSGTCPENLIIHDFMKQGDRNGNYSAYNKNTIKEVNILQAHINRILAAQYTQASGPVDGIFGKLTKQGVERLQTVLNEILKPIPILRIDGVVGPFTRSAINNSCG